METCITAFEYASSSLATTTRTCTNALDFYWGFLITLVVFLATWYVGYKLAHQK